MPRLEPVTIAARLAMMYLGGGSDSGGGRPRSVRELDVVYVGTVVVTKYRSACL